MNLDSIKLTREQRRMALRPYREASDDHDWVGIIGHIFGIADVLNAVNEAPCRWRYQYGVSLGVLGQAAECLRNPDGCGEDNCGHDRWQQSAQWLHMLDAGPLGIAMLTYAGSVLCRLYRWYERVGRSW